MQTRSPVDTRETSHDRRQLRDDPPQAITCVECGDRRKWRLPRASRTQTIRKLVDISHNHPLTLFARLC